MAHVMKTEETLKVEAGKWTLFLLSSYFNRIRWACPHNHILSPS